MSRMDQAHHVSHAARAGMLARPHAGGGRGRVARTLSQKIYWLGLGLRGCMRSFAWVNWPRERAAAHSVRATEVATRPDDLRPCISQLWPT